MNQNNIDFCLKGDASFDSFKTLFVEARDNFGEVDHGVIKMELLFPWPHWQVKANIFYLFHNKGLHAVWHGSFELLGQAIKDEIGYEWRGYLTEQINRVLWFGDIDGAGLLVTEIMMNVGIEASEGNKLPLFYFFHRILPISLLGFITMFKKIIIFYLHE